MGTYLNRTAGTATSSTAWTFSCWLKRSQYRDKDGQGTNYFFGNKIGSPDNNNWLGATFEDDDTLRVQSWYGGVQLRTSMKFRDTNAWYHIVLAADSSQSESSRLKIYVNSVQQTDMTVTNHPSSNFNFNWCNSGANHIVGSIQNSSNVYYDFFNGYMTHVAFVDGSQLTPSNFGETDSSTGIWKPKGSPTGVTYGNNGYFLKMENSGNLGLDSSGNGNNLTVNNAGTGAQVSDSPSNNFCTMNTLSQIGEQSQAETGNKTLGCLQTITRTGSGSDGACYGSLAIPKGGKWFWETKIASMSGNNDAIGVRTAYDYSEVVWYSNNGNLYVNNSNTGSPGTSYAQGDIIGIAVDTTNNQITFYKNGVALSPYTYSDMPEALKNGFSPFWNDFGGNPGPTCQANFGNPPFTISSTNADAAGVGSFEYTVPSGFYALCTKNIASQGGA